MAAHQQIHTIADRYHLEGLGLRVMKIGGIVGIVSLILSLVLAFVLENGIQRFFFSYLIAFCYFLSITLGALFFVAIQHITRAGWSVIVRRIAEILMGNFPLMIILFIPLIFGMGQLYHWTHSEVMAHDLLLQGKKPYLNIPFFLVRSVIYFAIWWMLSHFFLTRSLQQDSTGDPGLTVSMEKMSAPGLILFALTLSFAAIDYIMTLDGHWFSTMFGVYYFAGSVLSFFAALIIVSYLLQKSGRLLHTITIEHYHDMGKFLFAFVFFWGYIAFSQYMLIWYANIPEETHWFLRRQTGSWLWVSLILLFAHFIIPFLGLISRIPKRRKGLLFFWAIWILVVHYIDLYWLIMPEYSRAAAELSHNPELLGVANFGLFELLNFIGIAALYLMWSARTARGRALVPLKDPRLAESLAFENF